MLNALGPPPLTRSVVPLLLVHRTQNYMSTEFKIICKLGLSILALETVAFFARAPLSRTDAATMVLGMALVVLCSLSSAWDARRLNIVSRVICFGWVTLMSILAALVVRLSVTNTFDARL